MPDPSPNVQQRLPTTDNEDVRCEQLRTHEWGDSYRQGRLSVRQHRAYAHVDALAGSEAVARLLVERLTSASVNELAYASALTNLQREARVAVHFHPERHTGGGYSVVEGLLQYGVYKNQYQTGISNGSPTAFAGGERDLWERAMFGAAYEDIALAAERPAYGALILATHPDGPAPRFGSCHLELRAEVSQRCTFTWGGTNEQDALSRSGTLRSFAPVMAALLSQLESAPGAFGIADLTGTELVELLRSAGSPKHSGRLGNVLDSFIEAQIHGAVDLRVDVARLVADPAFVDTECGALLGELCARYGIELLWHPGYVLAVEDVPESFRAHRIGPLAQRVARAGIIDAACIGAAVNALRREPEDWLDGGTYDEALTTFRRLWHALVERGGAARGRRPAAAAD